MGGFHFPNHWTDMREIFTPEFVSLQEDRDRAIEDYLNNLTIAAAPPIFDFPGPVVISVTDLFPVASSQTYVKAYLTAVIAGTATIGMYKNGTLVGTLTLPGATTSMSVAFALSVVAGDYLQASVTAAGGGLVGLAVALG